MEILPWPLLVMWYGQTLLQGSLSVVLNHLEVYVTTSPILDKILRLKMTSYWLHDYIMDPRFESNSDGLYIFCLISLLESKVLICKKSQTHPFWAKCNE